MKWSTVNVILETEIFGTHQYMWRQKYYPNGDKISNDYDLIEKDEWYFGKGFRNFWGQPQIELGFDDLGNEVRTVKSFINAIDKSIEGKSTSFRITDSKNGKINISTTSNGMKKFVSDLLKYYVNSCVQNTNQTSHSYKNLPDPISVNSPLKLNEISVSSYDLNTKWIHKFIDENIR